MDVIEHILHHRGLNAIISSRDAFESSFVSLCDYKFWPVSDISKGNKMCYQKAKIFPDRFGLFEELLLDTKYAYDDYYYMLSEKISYVEGLKIHININSLIRQGNARKTKDNFVYDLIKKHHIFLKEFAKNNEISPADAKIILDAHSGTVGGVKTYGGYVWATQGFSFYSDQELKEMQTKFSDFAKKRGVNISDKDIKRFKYPCHFAAFDVVIDGKTQEIGKEFLLQTSWHGVYSAKANNNTEPVRYQNAYHKYGKKAARQELSKSFLFMLGKYNQPGKQNIWATIRQKANEFLAK